MPWRDSRKCGCFLLENDILGPYVLRATVFCGSALPFDMVNPNRESFSKESLRFKEAPRGGREGNAMDFDVVGSYGKWESQALAL